LKAYTLDFQTGSITLGDVVEAVWSLSAGFSTTVRDNLGQTPELQDFLLALSVDLRELREAAEWPGTRLIEGTAKVHAHRCSENALRQILKHGFALELWQQPRMPEDLALYRTDGSVVLESISHEGEAVVRLSEQELSTLPVSIRKSFVEAVGY